MIKKITSKDNARVKFAFSLKDSKTRKKEKMFLAETFKALEMALLNQQVVEIFTLKELEINQSIPQNIVSEDILKKLSSNVNPEGVVFIAKMKEIGNTNFDKILYLDHVSDPGNVGTLIRTALAFNYDLVVSSKDSCSFYNEKAINSSKGAIFAIPVLEEVELSSFKEDHQIIVSCLDDKAIDLSNIIYERRFVLVLGNESHGVSLDSLILADQKVKIKIQNIDSLNVSVAGGILMNKIH